MSMRKLLLVAGLGCVIASGNSLASYTSSFESDTVGSQPAGWTISGANGTTTSANVAQEGNNRFLAIRDADAAVSLNVAHGDPGEAAGFFEFDIRVNTGFTAEYFVDFTANTFFSPMRVEFFHNFNNTNNPLIFRNTGNNQFSFITNNFPIGSWETVRIEFTRLSGSGNPRGTYSTIWGGITNTVDYRDQGNNTLQIETVAFAAVNFNPGATFSFDLDNIQFIPEPSGLLLCSCGVLALFAIRRCSSKIGS